MYAVIFTATVGGQDSRYRKMAGQLRDLAMANAASQDGEIPIFVAISEHSLGRLAAAPHFADVTENSDLT